MLCFEGMYLSMHSTNNFNHAVTKNHAFENGMKTRTYRHSGNQTVISAVQCNDMI